MTIRNEQLDYLIAALQLLRSLPAGAENEPEQSAAHQLIAAINGRSGTGFPHPAADRPAPIEFERLARENDALIHQLEVMASAVGACSNCWGTIPSCEECGGKGKPGMLRPDRAAFDRYVLPVMTRVMGERPLDQDQPATRIYPLGL